MVPEKNLRHKGTSAGGLAAARDNTACGVGAAYRASLAGVRLISRPTSDAEEAQGISYGTLFPG